MRNDILDDLLSTVRDVIHGRMRRSIGIHSDDDLIQSTVLSVLEDPPTHAAKLLPYARTIARRKIARAVRRTMIERKALQALAGSQHTDGDPSNSLWIHLDHLRSELNEEERVVLSLLNSGYHDTSEIAHSSGLRKQCVRAAKRRIKNLTRNR